MAELSDDKHRWCVILAGGDGMRLRSLTRTVSGDERPKQFCPFLKGRTPLDVTRQHAKRICSPDQTLFVVTRPQQNYYTEALSDVQPYQLVVQPNNKGTGPAILLSLLHVARIDARAVVVFLPSDHHYENEGAFLDGVNTAFEAAGERPESVILLGAAPTHPEVGYGWIEPGLPIPSHRHSRLFRVRKFWEKPSLLLAEELLDRGCLWNTFVMVGSVHTFLAIVSHTAPHLYAAFAGYESRSASDECDHLYERLNPVDFSRTVLATSFEWLALSDLGCVGWTDLGEPERVASVFPHLHTGRAAGVEPNASNPLERKLPTNVTRPRSGESSKRSVEKSGTA